MNKIAFQIISVVLLASCGNKEEKIKILNSDNVISVKTAQVKSEQVDDKIIATGLLNIENEATLSFKVGGIIDKMLVSEGQFVKKGDLLASLKENEINAQFDQVSLAFEKAQRDYKRIANLYKDSVATLEQLQNAKTGLDIAKQTVELISFNKQYTSIVAQSDGFIIKKIANEGEIINPSIPVLTMSKTNGVDNWELKVGVSDKEWARISINEKATVQFDAFPKTKFTAYVFRKSQAVDQMSGSFQIELRVTFNNEKPAIGMFGKAIIVGNTNRYVNSIPVEALIQADGHKAFVFMPINGNSIKKVEVSILSFNEHNALIDSGIDLGQEVIISNNAFLNEQSKISITR